MEDTLAEVVTRLARDIDHDMLLQESGFIVVSEALRDNFSNVFDLDTARISKIAAIKEFRRATGCDLVAAKNAVEAIMSLAYSGETVVALNKKLAQANQDAERDFNEINKLRTALNAFIDSTDADTLRTMLRNKLF